MKTLYTLLINGKGATEIFLKYFKPTLIKQDKLLVANKSCNVYSYELKLKNKIIIIYAWSNNLQSTVGLTNQMRDEIGNWVKQQKFRIPTEEPKEIKIEYLIKNEKKDFTEISKTKKSLVNQNNKIQPTNQTQVMEPTINQFQNNLETTYFKISEDWHGKNMIITVTFRVGNYAGRTYQYNHDEVYENTIWHYGKLPCWKKHGCFMNSENIPRKVEEFVTEII